MHITALFKTAKLLRIKNFVDFVSSRTHDVRMSVHCFDGLESTSSISGKTK